MIDTNIVLIDSNILIYAYDKDEKAKTQIACKIIEKVMKNEIVIALSTQNLSEFYTNATKKIEKPISSEEAKSNIADWISLSNIHILKIKGLTILNAMDISTKFNISYWDALIAAVMQEYRITKIITENEKDFKKISWLTVINPFKK